MKDLPCPDCGGDDEKAATCKTCGGEGCHVLTQCPLQEVPADVWDFLPLAEDAEHGLLPVAGGVLNQTASFNQARRLVRTDRAYFKALMMKPNGNR